MIYISPIMYNSINCSLTLAVEVNTMRSFWVYNTDHADGDAFTYKIDIPAGTYTLIMLGATQPGQGILKVSIDGTVVTTWDMYSVVIVRNVEHKQTGIVVSPGGLVDLVVYVDGKNVTASNHYMVWTFLELHRTA